MTWDNLQIHSCHKAYCPPTWHWVNQGNKEFILNLWLVMSGRGHIRRNDDFIEISGGQCYLLREWVPHVASHDPKHPLIVPYVEFKVVDDNGSPYRPTRLPPECRRVDDADFLDKLIDRVIAAHNDNDEDGAVHWLRSALRELERQDARPIHTSAEKRQHDLIEEVSTHIRQYPERHFAIPDLAADAGYSTDHFIRLFRKYQGCTPGDFQIRCRIQAATQMLRFTMHSITEVADSLGYPDIYSFSKQFCHIIGMSPTAYRNGEQ